MCGTIDPWCTCDENLVLLAKSGMTPKGGGLLGKYHRKVGWRLGARDIAGGETI
jgi:hypothetical protein